MKKYVTHRNKSPYFRIVDLHGESENPNSEESRENNSIMDAFWDFLVALKREIIILGILFANE